MTCVAVVAHRHNQLGGGLVALRQLLVAEGIDDPLWFEVDKSKKAAKRVREAMEQGADRVLVWGGDGMVQRCIDVLAGTGATIGILPAGTANLLATNLDIPADLAGASPPSGLGSASTATRGSTERRVAPCWPTWGKSEPGCTRSRFVEMTRARRVDVRLDHKAPYELDGGDRKAPKRLRVLVEPLAITVCVPASS